MHIAVLGTGVVGRTIGTALTNKGHDVRLGSRNAENPDAVAWTKTAGTHGSVGTFADAAAFAGEFVFNCTLGSASLDAVRLAGENTIGGKILIDVTNPLDFSHGMPPSLFVCNTDSLAERIQRAMPSVRVVKSLNTMNCKVMVNPSLVPGDHNVFVCGDDATARVRVTDLLEDAFGWRRTNVVDLGDLTAARGMEMVLPIWLKLWAALGTPNINFFVPHARDLDVGLGTWDLGR